MINRITIRTLPILALITLAACTTPDIRYASPVIEPSAQFSSRYASIEVIDVTLPTYAASEEIFVEGPGGAISALGPLWADDPVRAITLQLSRDIAAITGATVAPEPWPFRGIADVRVDVRFNDMLATATGKFRISGQYFVAPEEAGRDQADQFSIEVPLPVNASPAQVATARAAAVAVLAEDIVNETLR